MIDHADTSQATNLAARRVSWSSAVAVLRSGSLRPLLALNILALAAALVLRPPVPPVDWIVGPTAALLAGGGLIGMRWCCVSVARPPLAGVLLLVDGAASGILLVLAGASHSPFYLVALGGAVWAAMRCPSRGGTAFAATFAAAFWAGLLLLAPPPIDLDDATKTVVLVAIVGAGSDWLRSIDGRAVAIAAATRSAGDAEQRRQRLVEAIGRASDVPVDSLLAAAQFGLSVPQAELLAYLMLGLTNQQIADAQCVSEATVKYRLTRLYRALHVSRRAQAIALGRQLGLDGLMEAGSE